MGFKQYLSHQPVNGDYDNYTENIDFKLLENPPMSLIATSGVEVCTLPVKKFRCRHSMSHKPATRKAKLKMCCN